MVIIEGVGARELMFDNLDELFDDIPHPGVRHRQKAKLEPPRRSDAVPRGTCLRCGLRGPHHDVNQCIAALRDKLADATMVRDKCR